MLRMGSGARAKIGIGIRRLRCPGGRNSSIILYNLATLISKVEWTRVVSSFRSVILSTRRLIHPRCVHNV